MKTDVVVTLLPTTNQSTDESNELTDNETAASSEEGIPENEKPAIPTPAMPTLYMYSPKKMNKQKKRNKGAQQIP